MADETLADLPRNARESLRIALREYRGARFADLRVYSVNTKGEVVPTKVGVTLRLPQLRQAIEALERAERTLLDEAAASGRGWHP